MTPLDFIDSSRLSLSICVAWLTAADRMRRSVRPSLLLGIFLFVLATEAAANSTLSKCPCGYYDAATGIVWMESIIVYFNETTTTPIPSFIEESYSHKFEKGWKTQFRTGADVSNINFSNFASAPSSPRSLELYVSPYTSDHLVVGSSVRTTRRDIQYGSFASLLRSPAKSAGGGGSVLSFALEYNSTQSISTNLQNTNKPSTASISMLANEEPPDANQIFYDGIDSLGRGMLSPWDYMEYRLEWTKAEIKFFIDGKLARSVSRSDNEGLLSVPAPLYLRHWSNGLATGSQGPPNLPTVANVGWVRLFFNSSLTTEKDHASFDGRCRTSRACHVHDMTLRGSSSYFEKSTKEWKQAAKNKPRRTAAIWLAVACLSVTTFLLLNPIWTRIQERFISAQEIEMTPQARRESTVLAQSRAELPTGLAIDFTPRNQTIESSVGTVTLVGKNRPSPTAASLNPSGSSSISQKPESSRAFRRRSAYRLDRSSRSEHDLNVEGQRNSEQEALREQLSPEMSSSAKGLDRVGTPHQVDLSSFSSVERKEQERKLSPADEATAIKDWRISWNSIGWEESLKPALFAPPIESPKAPEISTTELPNKQYDIDAKVTEPFPGFLKGHQPMEYLAGLLVISCLLVTAIDFNLTFVYGDLMPDNVIHSHSEEVARKTITPFLLNQIWIGPFLLTSARFLTTNYLRTGDLLVVAEKVVKRTFRLMLPVTAMVMLEYFFIDCSATKWLEYLPSITWSTWPFIKGYSNFGNFLSEVLELIYLIPNAAPVITFNYCTHVLWTIPVQLQGSWTALLAVIVVREMRTPWKRFSFYAFCIVNHWYALSWGSYFYFGTMLTDLDITYKWRPYLHARPVIYYLLLLACISFAFAGPTLDLLTQRTKIDYAAFEYGIHPNVTSGTPISESNLTGSPVYFYPRLNGFVFAVGLQAAVDLSPAFQNLFSLKLFMLIFPHCFTVYLLHGFIFWTFGSWLCVSLAVLGLSYRSNVLIVALCCYIVLALSTPLITPVLNCLGKTITKDIWRRAREEPPPRHPTLHPFPNDLFLNRSEITWERKPSKDVSGDEQERRVSRPISRIRKPSKDLRTSWHERQLSVDSGNNPQDSRVSRAMPFDRSPSKDLRTSWHESKLSMSPRVSWHEGESSAARRASWPHEEPSIDPRTSWHERKPSQDLRTSWHERNTSKAKRLERVEDMEEESEV